MKKTLLLATLFITGLSAFAQTTRMSLFEEFTGETCGPCASTNPGLNATLASNATKVIAIKWQVPIPTAPTNTWSLYKTNPGEANARLTYYGVNSAPQGRMDGKSLTVYGASSDHAANVTNGLISAAQSFTSPFSITLTREWDNGCAAINMTVAIQASANYTSTGVLNFRTVMVERLVQFSVQPGTNGEKDFYDPAIKSFVTALPGAWTNGQTHTFVINCPIPSYTRDKNQVALVGFIQSEGNKNVLQAARANEVLLPSNDEITTLDAKVDVTCTSSINPVVSIKNSGPNAINGFTIIPYADGIAGTPTSWSGTLPVNTATTLVLNSTATSTVTGSHTFSFAVVTTNNYLLTNISNKVKYLVASNYQTTPIVQGFTTSAFPPPNWSISNPNNTVATWTWANNAGSYGDVNEFGCLKFDFFTNTVIGDVDEIFLPPINLSGSGIPTLTFDYAKTDRNSENDKLDVLVSSDCGATWTNVYSKYGPLLATSPSTTNAYVAPNPQDWKTETIALTAFALPEVLVKLRATNDNGNNLYLDNINLSQPNPSGIAANTREDANLSIFPNPAANEATLKITSVNAGISTIKVMNAIGQVVYTKQASVNAGSTNIKLDTKEFANGVYFLIVESGKNSSTQKLIISK